MKIKIRNTKENEIAVPPVKISKQKKQLETHGKKWKANTVNNNIKYLIYFIVVVIFVIFFGIIFKLISTVQKSTFNSDSYSVLVDVSDPFLIIASSKEKKISIINLKNLEKGNKVSKSLSVLFPIDGLVILDKNNTFDSLVSYKTILKTIFTNSNKYENMTSIDFLKLISIAQSVPKKDVYILNEIEIDNISVDDFNNVSNIFKDLNIIDEQKSIEVINATLKEGLAGRVANILKYTGANVVSVTSTDARNKSFMVSSAYSKTLNRISHLLNIPYSIDEGFSSIADIKIVLGDDFLKYTN